MIILDNELNHIIGGFDAGRIGRKIGRGICQTVGVITFAPIGMISSMFAAIFPAAIITGLCNINTNKCEMAVCGVSAASGIAGLTGGGIVGYKLGTKIANKIFGED